MIYTDSPRGMGSSDQRRIALRSNVKGYEDIYRIKRGIILQRCIKSSLNKYLKRVRLEWAAAFERQPV
jgi:hypothetical protein